MASFDTIFTHMSCRSLATIAALSAGALIAAPKGLEIYWIDAEGGAATLIVTPSGQSMLIDTANRTPDDRDAKRIFSAAQKAGLQKIDILLTTHFHGDHIGAMDALSKMIPIGIYMDHGDSVELNRPQVMANHKAYIERSQGKRRSLQPGDSIPLKRVDIQVVSSAGKPISKKLKGAGSRASRSRSQAENRSC